MSLLMNLTIVTEICVMKAQVVIAVVSVYRKFLSYGC